ncbi:hypothetical protein [Kribbella kalugense]|uniref:Uncharacterized protein n=1 Tax=Kribbella kalugense TaxID=2512221 RepID=A0A4R7ZNC8_9ACTN|nr:hypothetical protein [Kribbella kalugense]TDW19373.1 hypothetical protein EV650_5979 [Kribbella kalugense]
MITARSFPTPDIVKTTNNPALWDQLGGFAQVQAAEANAALELLDERLEEAEGLEERTAAFEAAYRHVAEWRYQVAAQGRWTRPYSDVEAFRAPIPAGEWRGYRLTPNAADDLEPGSPASVLLTELEQVAKDRLMNGSNLHNPVNLPGGRTITGNLLDQGLHPGQVITQTARFADRQQLRQASFEILADLETQRAGKDRPNARDPELRQKFTDAAYCLIQGAEMQRGSDSIMRTFLVAAHTRVFDAAPVLPQAIDLDGMVRGQEGFSRVMRDQLRVLPPADEFGRTAAVSGRAPRMSAVRRDGEITR